MPIHFARNLYPGVNPHLNSFLQSEPGGWESFHAELVVQMRMALDAQLPPGYLALAEKSLQISETMLPEEFLTGVVIYQAGEGGALGRPITRIEVLSPANKPDGSHHPRYGLKRLETLQSGLRLVEVDYLHETPPVISGLASYPQREKDSYPYAIVVSDPRPTFDKGQAQVYSFGVDDPIPAVPIPLAGADRERIRRRMHVIITDYAAQG